MHFDLCPDITNIVFVILAMRPNVLRFSIGIMACLLLAAPASAHKLMVDCRLKDDRVRVEVFYDDDTPAQQAKVIVENENKEVIAEGKTDERGLWSYPVPAPGKYIIRAESVGHNAREVLVVPADKPTPEEAPATRTTTETPWLQIGVGLGVIAILCTGALLFRRGRQPSIPLD